MNRVPNKFSLEVRERMVRKVVEHEGQAYQSRWTTMVLIVEKISRFPCAGE